jgi:hypothetical protein
VLCAARSLNLPLRLMVCPLASRSPSSAGKSGVGVLEVAACMAQGLLAVYIPRGGDWVAAAKAGLGNAYFLNEVLRQNAGAFGSPTCCCGCTRMRRRCVLQRRLTVSLLRAWGVLLCSR